MECLSGSVLQGTSTPNTCCAFTHPVLLSPICPLLNALCLASAPQYTILFAYGVSAVDDSSPIPPDLDFF